jgi:chromosome segregation ATPase
MVRIDATTEQLRREIDRADKKVADSSRQMEAHQKKVSDSFDKMGAAAKRFFAVIAVAAIVNYAKKTAELQDKIAKLSDTTGVSVRALSELRHAASLSGVSLEGLGKSMQIASRNISEAAQGTGTAKDALEQLGVSVQELKNLKPDQQLEVIAEALTKVSNSSDKTRLAMDIFGRSAGQLMPLLKDGAAGIRDLREEAVKLGIAFDEKAARAAEKLNDDIERLQARFEGFAFALTGVVVPAINDLIDFVQLLRGEFKGLSSPLLIKELDRVTQDINRMSGELNEALSKKASTGSGSLDTFIESRQRQLTELKTKHEQLFQAIDKNLEADRTAEQRERRLAESRDRATVATNKQTSATNKQTSATKKHTKEIDANADAFDRLYEATERQQEELARFEEASRRHAEESMRPWLHAIDNVQDSFADMLVEGEFSFDTLAQIAKRAAAEAAAAWVIKPAFDAIGGAVFGGTTSTSGGGGIGGGMGQLAQTGISKGLGLTGIGAGIDAWGAASMPAIFGTGASPI